MAKLQNALNHPEVTAALAAQATFGATPPSSPRFTIRVGADEITVFANCSGSVSTCTDPPPGVQTLRVMLEQIAMQQVCEPVPVSSVCTMPFDPGEGPGTIFVYAFHPQTGTCVPQVYTGVGGNENRFDDLASCRATCPDAATSGGCPPNRVFVDDLCVECGPAGGCSATATACGLLCTGDVDCQGDGAFVQCSERGLCELDPARSTAGCPI